MAVAGIEPKTSDGGQGAIYGLPGDIADRLPIHPYGASLVLQARAAAIATRHFVHKGFEIALDPLPGTAFVQTPTVWDQALKVASTVARTVQEGVDLPRAQRRHGGVQVNFEHIGDMIEHLLAVTLFKGAAVVDIESALIGG